MTSPYSGLDFFGFFPLFFSRMVLFLTGNLSWQQMASDEIQCCVLLFLGLSLSILGSFLVLKQMTMLANALSHTILLGIIGSFLLFHGWFSVEHLESSFTSMKVLWVASLVSGILTVLLTQFCTQVLHLQEDASIGLVFTTLFALGILLVTLYTKNLHLGTEAVMGNIDALHLDDLKTSMYLAGITILVIGMFFRGFFVGAFDVGFAKSLGWPTYLLNYLLMVLTAASAIASFRAVGVLLFLSFLVGPTLISLRYVCSIKTLIGMSFLVSVLCSFVAVALSRHLLTVFHMPLSTSGLLVALLSALYGTLILYSLLMKKLKRRKVCPINA
jgi:manganese/zinc/iron transport system permease protein